MEIKATYFKKIDGTIFVVTHNGKADGVFKTQAAANKLRDIMRTGGTYAEVRVGHFVSDDKIVTI